MDTPSGNSSTSPGKTGGKEERKDCHRSGEDDLDMVRVREGRRAFREFHAQCFWYMPPDFGDHPGGRTGDCPRSAVARRPPGGFLLRRQTVPLTSRTSLRASPDLNPARREPAGAAPGRGTVDRRHQTTPAGRSMMPHTFDFAGLTLTVSIETDPRIEGFDPVSPGQGAGGLYEWRTEVTAPDADSRLLGWSLRPPRRRPFRGGELHRLDRCAGGRPAPRVRAGPPRGDRQARPDQPALGGGGAHLRHLVLPLHRAAQPRRRQPLLHRLHGSRPRCRHPPELLRRGRRGGAEAPLLQDLRMAGRHLPVSRPAPPLRRGARLRPRARPLPPGADRRGSGRGLGPGLVLLVRDQGERRRGLHPRHGAAAERLGVRVDHRRRRLVRARPLRRGDRALHRRREQVPRHGRARPPSAGGRPENPALVRAGLPSRRDRRGAVRRRAPVSPAGAGEPRAVPLPAQPGGAGLCGAHGRPPDAHLLRGRPQDRLHRSPDGARGPALPGGARPRHRGVRGSGAGAARGDSPLDHGGSPGRPDRVPHELLDPGDAPLRHQPPRPGRPLRRRPHPPACAPA